MLIVPASDDSETRLDYTRRLPGFLDELGARLGTLPVLPRPPPASRRRRWPLGYARKVAALLPYPSPRRRTGMPVVFLGSGAAGFPPGPVRRPPAHWRSPWPGLPPGPPGGLPAGAEGRRGLYRETFDKRKEKPF